MTGRGSGTVCPVCLQEPFRKQMPAVDAYLPETPCLTPVFTGCSGVRYKCPSPGHIAPDPSSYHIFEHLSTTILSVFFFAKVV